MANARSLASEFERRIQERGAQFSLKYQRIIISDETELTELEMIEIAREVFGERVVPAQTAAAECPSVRVEVEAEEGDVRVRVPTPPSAPQQDKEELFRELMSKRLEELKAIARAFPKDIKNYGGWSGKGKADLAHWILLRRS